MPDETKIEVDLPTPEPEKPAPKKRRPWPKEFDAKRSPPGGYEIKVPDEDWELIHGEEPLSVMRKRGQTIPAPFDNEENVLGKVGDVIRVEKGCRRCAARAYVIHHHAAVCLGCGTTMP